MTRIFVHEHFAGKPAAASDARRPPDEDLAALRAAGIEMRDALVADLLRVPGVSVTCSVADGADDDRPAAHPRLRCVARPDGEAEPGFVRRQARTCDAAWIVAPETGGVLAGLEAAVRGVARWIGCDAASIAVAGSKRRTTAALAAHGLPTPAAFAHDRAGAWIVKPDDGAGTCRTRRHPEREAALRDVASRRLAGEDACAEPFIEGEPLSLSAIVGSDLARLVAINRQCIVVGPDGRLRDEGVRAAAIDDRDPRAAALRELAGGVAAALPGLRGFVGIDLVWNEERGPVLIEVNPRLTCAWPGLPARRDGALAAEVLALFLPAEVAHAPAA